MSEAYALLRHKIAEVLYRSQGQCHVRIVGQPIHATVASYGENMVGILRYNPSVRMAFQLFVSDDNGAQTAIDFPPMGYAISSVEFIDANGEPLSAISLPPDSANQFAQGDNITTAVTLREIAEMIHNVNNTVHDNANKIAAIAQEVHNVSSKLDRTQIVLDELKTKVTGESTIRNANNAVEHQRLTNIEKLLTDMFHSNQGIAKQVNEVNVVNSQSLKAVEARMSTILAQNESFSEQVAAISDQLHASREMSPVLNIPDNNQQPPAAVAQPVQPSVAQPVPPPPVQRLPNIEPSVARELSPQDVQDLISNTNSKHHAAENAVWNEWVDTRTDTIAIFTSAVKVKLLRCPYAFPFKKNKLDFVRLINKVAELAAVFASDTAACETQQRQQSAVITNLNGLNSLHQDFTAFLNSTDPQDVAELSICLRSPETAQLNLRFLQRARYPTSDVSWDEFKKEAASGIIFVNGQRFVYTPFTFKALN